MFYRLPEWKSKIKCKRFTPNLASTQNVSKKLSLSSKKSKRESWLVELLKKKGKSQKGIKRKACKSMAKRRKSSPTISNYLGRRNILIKEAKIENHYLPLTYALVIHGSLVEYALRFLI